jgi:hypothetical protein
MHKDIGKCNSNALYDIIEKVNPEIIFEEFDILRTEDEYYKNGYYRNRIGTTVETIAIMKYLENHPNTLHIPVDTYPVEDFPKGMYNKISNANQEYANLVEMIFLLSCQQGFSYINSLECNNLFRKIHDIEKEIVKFLNDEILLSEYKSWQSVTDNRENEMISNIYHYSENNRYGNAIFIIGAEHKISILDKIHKYEKNGLKLNWNYSNYENIL